MTRPTHRNTTWDVARFETSMQRWVDLSEPGFGVALINDCKYGYDAKGNVVRLTLVKSPVFPWPDADQGLHRFRYALFVHDGDRGAVHDEAEAFNLPLQLIEGAAGSSRETISLFEVLGDGVTVEAIKKAEDGTAVVVRLCETRGRRQTVTLDFGAAGRNVHEATLLEVPGAQLADNAHKLPLTFAPFEVRTLLLGPPARRLK